MTNERTKSGAKPGSKRSGRPRAGGQGGHIPAEQRHEMIATAAYFRAEQRGFCGDSLDDWLAAEAEVDERLRQTPPGAN